MNENWLCWPCDVDVSFVVKKSPTRTFQWPFFVRFFASFFSLPCIVDQTAFLPHRQHIFFLTNWFYLFFFQLHFSHENQIGTIETEWLPAYFPCEQVAYSLSYYWFNFLLLTATSVSIYAREKKNAFTEVLVLIRLKMASLLCDMRRNQISTTNHRLFRFATYQPLWTTATTTMLTKKIIILILDTRIKKHLR